MYAKNSCTSTICPCLPEPPVATVLLADEDLRILAIKYKAVTSSVALLETNLATVKSKSDAKLSHSTITIQIALILY